MRDPWRAEDSPVGVTPPLANQPSIQEGGRKPNGKALGSLAVRAVHSSEEHRGNPVDPEKKIMAGLESERAPGEGTAAFSSPGNALARWERELISNARTTRRLDTPDDVAD